MGEPSLRVLLVEDDADDAALIRDYLREAPEYDIRLEHVDRLSLGLQRAESEPFDALLLDLCLPDSWGLETFRTFHRRAPDTPIVVMTGAEVMETALQAVREGASDYLFKGELGGSLLIRVILYAVERSRRFRAEAALLASRRELEIARAIQMGLYPASAPDLPGYDIAGNCFPAESVGGDYFDFFHLQDGGLGIAIGDAMGHGVGAALLSAGFRSALHSLALTDRPVGDILRLTNQILTNGSSLVGFGTLLLIHLDPKSGSMVYASAGHEPGLILDQTGRLRQTLPSTAIPLGVEPRAKFPESDEIALAPGDILVLPTDGFRQSWSEATTEAAAERLVEVVRHHQARPAAAIVDALAAAVCSPWSPSPPPDDFSVITAKIAADIRFCEAP